MTDDGHTFVSGRSLLGGKGPALGRRYAKDPEKTRRDVKAAKPLGLEVPREAEGASPTRRHVHGSGSVPEVHEVRHGEGDLPPVPVGVYDPYRVELMGVGVGQGTQHEYVHGAEDGRVRANADGQGEDGKGNEAPAPLQGLEAILHILPDQIHGVFRPKEVPGMLKRSQRPEEDLLRTFFPSLPPEVELRLPLSLQLLAPPSRSQGAGYPNQPKCDQEPQGAGRTAAEGPRHDSQRAGGPGAGRTGLTKSVAGGGGSGPGEPATDAAPEPPGAHGLRLL